MKPYLLNLEPTDYSSHATNLLKEHFEVTEQEMSREELIRNISKYHVIIVRLGHQIDKEVLEKARNLKAIVTATTGLNHIDLKQANEKKCDVLSLKGEVSFLNSICATAEHTMGLLLSLSRNIPQAFINVRSCEWDRDSFKGHELFGKTIGILGVGRLGKKVAKYSLAFGMNVIGCDIKQEEEIDIKYVCKDELLKQSDILSIHLPYTKETHHYLHAKDFKKIKESALIINTARGEIIDEQALLNALQTQNIAGAAIDVMQGEYALKTSWPQNDPLIHYAQKNHNLIITPHIGGATYESMENTEIFMAKKLIKHITNH